MTAPATAPEQNTLPPPTMAAPVTAPNYDGIPVPKIINYIWLGQTFDHFNQTQIRNCAKQNKGHKIQLWLDDFSMIDLQGPSNGPTLSRILDTHTFRGYKYAVGKVIVAENVRKYMTMFVSAQQQYLSYIKENPVAVSLIKTIIDFKLFVIRNYLNVQIRYMSSDFYGPLLAAAAQRHLQPGGSFTEDTLRACGQENKGPELRLLEWAFYERFRKNYGAATNLLRVQLLQTNPGIYIDHDDSVPAFGDLTGFKYARSADYLPTNAFLASGDGHPFLQFLRYQILNKYTVLHANRNNFLDFTKPSKPTHPDDLDHPFITNTDSLSGPSAFAEVVKQVRAGMLGPNVNLVNAWLKTVRINPTGRKTWALKGL